MNHLLKVIAKDIYYVGVNDRQKQLFENMWPLPYGVSYNSYLINGEKTALIDTVDVCYSDRFFQRIDQILGDKPLDYLIVDHMEPDHSGSIRLLRQKYPNVQIVGNKKTFDMLNGFYGICEGLYEVKEGDVLDLGNHQLTFVTAPMVHWPEVMFTYDQTEKVLFSADAFGTYGTLNGGVVDEDMDVTHFKNEMIRYYSNIVGKYGGPVQKALAKMNGIVCDYICPTHGPVWKKNQKEVVELYDRLSRYEGELGVTLVFGTMYGNTEEMAEIIAASLAQNGIKKVRMHSLASSHPSYILQDIFDNKGLILGAPTYSNSIYPEMQAVLDRLELREVKNRIYGCFGSFSWASKSLKHLTAFGEQMNWECVGSPVEMKQGLNPDVYEACVQLGKDMAIKLLEK